MKFVLFSLLSLMFLSGCRSGADAPDATGASLLRIPTWSFLAKASVAFSMEQAVVPKDVYVFPALRLNSQGQPIDQLAYWALDDGSIRWNSAAPLSTELKAIVEKKLGTLGFRSLPFSALTAATTDHSILVFNLYYRETSASQDNPNADLEASWSTFIRITAATFPRDLNPNAKRDLMNQEVVTLFNGRDKGEDVIKRCHAYLLDYIGINRQWSEMVNLLD